MEEFIFNNKSLITRLLEITAAVTGLLLYKKYNKTAAKFFIYFLVYVSICDFISSYSRYTFGNGFLNFLEGTILEKNFWWSTLFWKIGAVVFFLFYFEKILTSKRNKIILKYSKYFFVVFCLIYILCNLQDYFNKFFPIISIIGTFFIMLCVGLYFMETLLSEKILTFYKSLNFYISCAIFIWWLIITPVVFYDIYSSTSDWNFVILKWQIYLFANIFMYSTFIIGLLVSEPENTKAI